MTATSEAHASPGLVAAYVSGAPGVSAGDKWALEAHLENCAGCRDLLARAVPELASVVTVQLGAVWAAVDAAAVGRPVPIRSPLLRVLRQWAAPSVLPWLLMGVLVTLAAVGIDLMASSVRPTALVLLVSPVVPLLAVAAAWTERLDQMSELTVSSPRAGLQLVLRRTAAILAVLLPVLTVAGGVVGVPLVLALLPCLAFTVGSLALGTVFGVGRAAAALGGLWASLVIAPSLAFGELSALLSPSSLPAWGFAVVAAAVVVVVRASAFTRLPHTGLNLATGGRSR